MIKNQAIQVADRRGYHCDEQGRIYNKRGQPVKAFRYTGQYLAFSVRLGKKVVKVPVHRFVAFQIHGEVVLNEGVQVRHLDNNPTNNAWSNLSFGTAHENRMDIPRQTRINRARHAANQRWKGAA